MEREAFDAQTLRFLTAFFQIESQNTKEMIVSHAEAAERDGSLKAIAPVAIQ